MAKSTTYGNQSGGLFQFVCHTPTAMGALIASLIYIFLATTLRKTTRSPSVEGDRITEIEPASENWWQGTNQHGEIGLFPGMSELFLWSGWRLMDVGVANYVEVQE